MSRYDGQHRRLRRTIAAKVEAGNAKCWRCREPIIPGTAWHLGHDDSGRGWKGPEHELCNTRAAGRKGRAMQLADRAEASYPDPEADREAWADLPFPDPEPHSQGTRWSRHWHGPANPRCPDCRRLRRACDAAEVAA